MPASATTFLAIYTTPVYATSIDAVMNALDALKLLACAIVGGIGAIVVIKGAMSLGTAIKDRDTTTIATAAGEILGGAVMCGVTGFLAYLGLS